MVQSNMPSKGETRDGGNSSLESLSRTLEALEARLSKLAGPMRPAALPDPFTPEPSLSAGMVAAKDSLAARMPVSRPSERRKPSLSDAVSEIAMRRQMLDEAPPEAASAEPSRAFAPHAEMPARPSQSPLRRDPDALRQTAPRDEAAPRDETGADRLLHRLSGDVEALRADGSNYALMAEVAEELQRLRRDLKSEGPTRTDPRFDEMRNAFDDLRQMIETRQSAEVIGAEMTEISASLARLTEEGADRATLNTLRAELEEMRSLFGQMAKETSVVAVGRRWDAFESRYTEQAERETEARHDLKNELERLRESLRSLASQDNIRAVEKRWDEFETFYKETPPAPSGDEISKLLRDELEGMRAKLEDMADTAPAAADARWGALEKRLDSREIEASIQTLAARMSEIETVLTRLPDTLGIAPLEERMRALAMGVDTLARRDGEVELEHFVAMEERLDEISRAIVATSRQAPPVIDMAPIERIEARIATLTARVDRFSDAGDAEMLSLRIAELSDRVEELAGSNAVTETIAARMMALAERFDSAIADMEQPRIDADDIAARMNSLAERFDAAFAELERQPRVDTAAIEQRLSALALRLEDAGQPRADQEMMRSLEAQIARLSQHLAEAGSLSSDDFTEDFDRRLAAVEQRLDENREALIAAAREAADETARRMQDAGDRRQSEHVAQLSENLRSLESLSRETDDRSNKVFDAVHSTLLKIVDRLEQIETEISRGGAPAREVAADVRTDRAAAHRAAASLPAAAEPAEAPTPRGLRDAIARRLPGRGAAEPAAATAAEALLDRPEPAFDDRERERVAAPSLDASGMIDQSEANRPLEPGSGAPDIGALLERVRLQQRNKGSGAAPEPVGEAETRAAARRAVKAAVAEAEMLRSPSAAGAGAERKFSLSELVSRRRKTILMGVTAVLVALAALPVGKALMSRVDGEAPDRINLEGNADPAETMPMLGGDAAAPAMPAPPKVESVVPAAPQKGASMAPRPSSDTALATVSPAPAATQPATATAATPAAADPAATMMTAATTTSAPQGFAPPSSARIGAAKDNSAATDDAIILSTAKAKLPEAAIGAAPAVADTIGTPALVAAAKANDPKAFFEIGLRLLEGRGGEPKAGEAVNWFAQAATRGFAPAQYSLGTLFEKGNGVPRDTGAARDWYLLAAKQGNVRAMHNLAVLYATGIEGKSDPETAAIWFEKAADFGMRDSQYNLGILYARGSGVEQSLSNSYKWFAIVAKSGDKDAADKMDEVAKSLAPDQLAAAKADVAGWSMKERPEEANTVEVPKEWADAKSDNTASVDMKRAVRNIQAILGKLGYDAGEPDGVAGGKTATAILAFQKDAGLTPTGKIDETLIRALLQRKDG